MSILKPSYSVCASYSVCVCVCPSQFCTAFLLLACAQWISDLYEAADVNTLTMIFFVVVLLAATQVHKARSMLARMWLDMCAVQCCFMPVPGR